MEVVVLWLGAGAIVGWLANQIMVKDSYGTQTDLIIGAVGGLIGGVLFPQFGFLLGGVPRPYRQSGDRRGDCHLWQQVRQEIAAARWIEAP